MQSLIDTSFECSSHPRGKPILDSFDPSEEFSLDHWSQLSRLLEEESSQDLGSSARIGETSEMESATTYQHFARDVV